MNLPPRAFLLTLGLLLATVSAPAQFTLDIRPVSPGAGELRFTLAQGYYYCLESSGDLSGAFTQASGWMLGNETKSVWSLNYPVNPSPDGGSGNVPVTGTFSLYPFDDGKAVVSWRDPADVRYNAIVAADYSGLPPIASIPESATAPSAMLLVGRIAWDPAYDLLAPTLLPTEQQTVSSPASRLPRRHWLPRSRAARPVPDSSSTVKNISCASAAWNWTRAETGSIFPERGFPSM